MSRIHIFLGLVGFVLLFSACSTTRHIPEGEYLLDKVNIQMTDKGADKTLLLPYIQQNANSAKWGVYLYNWVDNDSNFFKRFIRKIGEPPVIFRHEKVNLSVNELSKEMANLGYLNSQVTAQVDTFGRKVQVTYRVHNGEPHRVRNYTIDISQMRRNNYQNSNRENRSNRTNSTRRSNWYNNPFRNRELIQEGTIFSMHTLDKERQRINTQLRNQGYFRQAEDNLHYFADTTLRSNQVDLSLALLDTTRMTSYTVQRINVFSGFDPLEPKSYQIVDSVDLGGIHIYYDKLHFLRSQMIANKIRVRPESRFRERAGESTFMAFQTLSCMRRVDLQYEENNYSDSTLLDCNIYLTPGNYHSLRAGFEGTNKAGDLGIALDIVYGNLNIFNGSEIFNINLRGAYEFVGGFSDNSQFNNFYELTFRPSLTFPKLHLPFFNSLVSEQFNTQTQYSLGYNVQRRPEYIRDFFNFTWKVNWASQQSMISHTLSLVDINYVNMPWKSARFEDYLNNAIDSITKFSYNNIFTAGINYNLIYSNASVGRIRQNLYTIRFNAETSGNALYFITGGSPTLFNNPYAQYVKGDIDFSQTFRLSANNGWAFRIGVGVAYPYLNSSILPFEKRYYGGGPNHVRGWSTRNLGPGIYNQGLNNPTTHVGDINLILTTEYRMKVLSWLEPAFFIDAGNIWTIKDYPDQSGGLFRWNKFYEEVAVGTGLGLRFDLSILILRVDFGTRVYDPAREAGKRFAFLKGNFWGNSAAYFAIGYPF